MYREGPHPLLRTSLLIASLSCVVSCAVDRQPSDLDAGSASTALAPVRQHESLALLERLAGAPEEAGAVHPNHRAMVTLPPNAQAAFQLTAHSGASIAVTLEGAETIAAESEGPYTLYPKALRGADLIQRLRDDGLEDSLLFREAPARRDVTYRVALQAGVAGLRLVANTLEFLDAKGTPQLRVAPPFLIDAERRRHDATLAVEGCAFDRNPAAPFQRRVTSPKAKSCLVRVSWEAADLKYPAVLDPVWSTTGSMVARRTWHSSTSYTSASRTLILVAGGYDGTSGVTSVLSSAEVFDPDSNGGAGAWAATGSLSNGRQGHAAALMSDNTILVTGGNQSVPGSASNTSSVELYNPSTGLWSSKASLLQGRTNHTATALFDGRVLVVGGLYTAFNGCPASSYTPEIYDPSTNAWTYVTTMANGSGLGATRAYHTAVRLPSGSVLVAGGYNPPPACGTGASWTNGAQLFNPTTNRWSDTGSMASGRGNHQAVLLPNGNVLVAGGNMSGVNYFATAEVYNTSTGTWSSAASMTNARADYTLSLSTVNGLTKTVAVAGSPTYLASQATTEIFEPATSKWFALSSLSTSRRTHAASTLADGRIVVSGGQSSATYLTSVEIFDPNTPMPNGLTCSTSAQCTSGNCIDGFCCNTDCSGECNRCDQSGSQGTCSIMNASYAGSPSCSPYFCDGTNPACRTSCTLDTHCVSGYFCSSNQCVPKYANGTACTATNQCSSGQCSDGVCCNSACSSGNCDRCDLPRALGTCTTSQKVDDESAACGASLCTGNSASCISMCRSDADCKSNAYCPLIYQDGLGNPYGYCAYKQANGSTCTGANACTSNICTDGVCCDAICNGGPCDRCDLTGNVGHCIIAPDGTAGNPSTACKPYLCDGESSSCPNSCVANLDCDSSGWCNNGQCTLKKSNGQVCSTGPECTSGNCIDGYCCNGACSNGCDRCDISGKLGTCSIAPLGSSGANPSCSPFVCNGAQVNCPSSCTADSQCASGYYCSSSTCIPKKTQGASCTTAGQCLTGFCNDGFCCDQACTGGCDRCAMSLGAAANGACTIVAKGDTGTSPSCGNYVCNGTDGACPGTCQSDNDCAINSYCDANHTCQAKKASSLSCSAGNQCLSGFCADGVCCNQACEGQCQACNATGSVGSCKAINGDPVGSRTACVGAGSTCGGFCDGLHLTCQYPSSPTVCQAASCTNGVAQLTAYCDGTGSCPATTQSCAPYVCGATACKTSCTSDADCISGDYCDANAQCVPKITTGQVCSRAGQCESGFCADGVCCGSACDGQCEACNQTGSVGTCTAVTGAPVGARQSCTGSGLCGGTCNGTNRATCTYAGATQSCSLAQCSNGSYTGAGACNGAGTCQTPAPFSCAPFLCSGSVCATSCSSDAECVAGSYCAANHSCQAKKAAGTVCSAASECTSGFCADGVCCNAACTEQCKACNQTGSPGRCTFVTGAPMNGRTACSGSGTCGATCTGSSASCEYPSGNTCQDASCQNGVSSSASVCNGSGQCAGATTASCAPYTCGSNACRTSCSSDAECSTGNYCDAGTHTCQPKAVSGSCTSGTQCASGYCVDGVCCDRACNGQCEACNVVGSTGTCQAVSGAPVGTRPLCAGSGTCGGYCNGVNGNSCTFPASSNVCQAATCSFGVATTAATCDGAGQCGATTTSSCGEYICKGTVCGTSCVTSSDCIAGDVCKTGVCEPKQGKGGSCALNEDCLSGSCADGICCDRACNGQCEACNLAGSLGQCSPVLGAPPVGKPSCGGDGSVCNGFCDGQNGLFCSYPQLETECRSASCTSGAATSAAACNGFGSCMQPFTQSCGGYQCGATQCLMACGGDSDCANGWYCSGSMCLRKGDLGDVCGNNEQCGSGFCADGRCCNSACDGQCESCGEAASPGTCVAVTGSPRGQRSACAGNGGLCGGVCNGTERKSCAMPKAGTVCGGAFCAGTVAYEASSCDGQGTCELGGSVACANGCSNGACLYVDGGFEPDAGFEPDGGLEPDAGELADAGSIADAGLAEDGGSLADGGEEIDAGTADAGDVDAGDVDAGLLADGGAVLDAGEDDPRERPVRGGGCTGCSSSGGALGVLMLAGLIARRRKPMHG